MLFYVFTCDSSDNKVLKWVIIVYIRSMSSFVKFVGQMSKKVYDIRKIFPKTTLLVYVCFVKFYMFILDETHVAGP